MATNPLARLDNTEAGSPGLIHPVLQAASMTESAAEDNYRDIKQLATSMATLHSSSERAVATPLHT